MARIDSRNPKFSYLSVHGPPARDAPPRNAPPRNAPR